MSEEKQIEEMARTLCGEKEKSCAECESCYRCEFWVESSILFKAGYRKQNLERCDDCIHFKVCDEVNGLKCRSEFIWYDAKSGCPYYKTADVSPRKEKKRCGDCIHYGKCSPYVSPDECFPEVEGGCDAFRASSDLVPKARLVELFEEIEKHECKPRPEAVAIYVLRVDQLTELKKKYLEDRT